MTKTGSFLFSLHSSILMAAYLLLLPDSSFSTTNGYQSGIPEVINWVKLAATQKVNQIALESAIQAKDEQAVQELLLRGPEIKLANYNESETHKLLLHKAANFKDKDLAIQVIKLLIENGANVSTKLRGEIFLHKLCDYNRGALTPAQFQDVAVFLISRELSYLFNKPDSMHVITPFHFAVKFIEIENGTLGLLRNNSVNFNAVTTRGESILHWAVGGSRSNRLVSELITLGADPRHVDKDKKNALHLAAIADSVENIKLFVNLGLDVNKVGGFFKMTPLHLAVEHGSNKVEKVRYLIEHGADVDTKDGRGNTPLGDAMDNYFEEDRDELLSLLRNNQ